MRTIGDLNSTQVRILGALLEKEEATPEYYPPTIKGLLAACNQKSNREPVMTLGEGELLDELETLRSEVLVWRGDGTRVPRWSQSISRRLKLDQQEKAVLSVLMLRGPQTVGELRSRTQRLCEFTTLFEVESTLGRLAAEDRDLVVELSRQPGHKENRWAQRLGGDISLPGASSPRIERQDESSADMSLSQRLGTLENRVDQLTRVVEQLLEDLGT